jgi:hypothetical protein
MNIHELERHLAEEGCNPIHYAISTRGSASDAFCLTNENGQWRAFVTGKAIFKTRVLIETVPMKD